jgi:type IV pilus assembly protein PilB
VTRLVDMGIEYFLLANTLRVVEAQRLLRRLCPRCKEPYDPTPEMVREYGMIEGKPIYRAKGCPECRGVGYKGRVGIFEIIRITPKLRDAIQVKTPLPEMKKMASEEKMWLLKDSGMEKVRDGLTSLEEVVTVTVEEGGGH